MGLFVLELVPHCIQIPNDIGKNKELRVQIIQTVIRCLF